MLNTKRSGVLILPSTFWLTLFFLLPLSLILIISLIRCSAHGCSIYGGLIWEFNLKNYLRALDLQFLNVFLRSLFIAAITTLLCLILGYPLAYWLARRPKPLKNLLFFLVMVPFWANSLILAYAWMIILRSEGVLDTALSSLGLIRGSLNILYAPPAVVIGLVYWYLPFMIYPLYASIEKLDFSLIEAAHDLGAGKLQVFRRILLPLTKPGIVAGCVLVFVPSLGEFVIPKLLGGSKTLMIGNLIQDQFLGVARDWPFGAALSLILMLIVMVGLRIYFKASKERVWSA